MCHLCRKAQALQSLDSKALKPVSLALARIHRNVEPNFGDLWTWRHDATLGLRTVLGGLHKVVPLSALTEMIKEVDDELVHCKKQMAEHPAIEVLVTTRSGKSADSENSRTPSDSVSVRARKKREQETTAERIKDGKSSRKSEAKKDLSRYHLSGSDLDPHPALIKRSCLIVEAWLKTSDTSAAMRHEKDLDGVSVVSIPGGFHQRPQLDVEIWDRPLRKRQSLPACFTPRGEDHSLQHHRQQPDLKASFNTDLDLDNLVTGKMSRSASPRCKVKFIEKLLSALHSKKSETATKKHGKQRRVRFEDETSPQRRRVKREKSKMQADDSTIEESIRRISTISHHDTNPYRSSNIGASSAILNSKESRKHVDQKVEGWESDSSVLSSRASEINLGSIMEQPATPPPASISNISLPRPQRSRHFQPSPSKPNPSWQSYSRSQSQASTNAQTSHGTATSSSTSRHIKPLPPSFTSIVPPVYKTFGSDKSDFDKNRERRRAERNAVTPAPPRKTANPAPRKEPNRRIVSPVAKDLRARRAELASKTPAKEKYHRDERERLWSS